jgi:hypothetical protein
MRRRHSGSLVQRRRVSSRVPAAYSLPPRGRGARQAPRVWARV